MGIVLNVIAFAVVVCVFGDGINDFTLNIFDLSENYFSLSEYIEKQKNWGVQQGQMAEINKLQFNGSSVCTAERTKTQKQLKWTLILFRQ